MCVGLLSVAAYAETAQQDGVEVSFTTDKAEYAKGEQITTTLMVINTNGNEVQNVSLTVSTPDGYVPDTESMTELHVDTLASNETATLTTVFVSSGVGTIPETGSNNVLLIGIVLFVVGAVGITVMTILTKKHKSAVSLLLCVAMIATALSGVAWAARANAEESSEPSTITLTQTVNIDGVETTLNANVSYGGSTPVPDDVGEISYSEPLEGHVAYDETTEIYYVDNQILLIAEPDITKAQIEALVDEYDGDVVGYIELTDDFQIEFPDALSLDELNSIVSELSDNECVSETMLNYMFETSIDFIPNDSEWLHQEWSAEFPEGKNWGVEAIDCIDAWELYPYISTNTVRVGIIDTMFDTNHEDLEFVRVWNNPNSIQDEDDADKPSHGTHVAGTIGAKWNNHKGIAGVAPDVELYGFSVKGSNTDPMVLQNDLSDYMKWKYALANLITANCKVINVSMSMGGQLDTQARIFGDFLNKLLSYGYDFVIVKSAGNEPTDTMNSGLFTGITIPEVKDRIIVVGAIGTKGSYHNGWFGWFGDRIFKGYYYVEGCCHGTRVDVAAPGVKIYSTIPGNKYGNKSGTSMAAPHISGIAALCFAVNDSLTGKQVKQIITNELRDTRVDLFPTVTVNVSDTESYTYPIPSALKCIIVAASIDGDAVSPTNPSTGIVMGQVFESENSWWLSGASIAAYRVSSHDGNLSGFAASTSTDLTGGYALALEAGQYYLNIYADGYLPFAIADVTVTNDRTTYIENVYLIPETEDSFDVTGTVRNALTGDALDGVMVRFRTGWNNTSGELAVDASGNQAITTTDAYGMYTINMGACCYTAEFSKDGFVTGYVNVISSSQSGMQDAVLTPVLSNDEFRIVLTWGENPNDLDSHVEGTLSNGESFHVYYSHQSHFDGDIEVCNLDVDDTTSYGPETITLRPTTVYPYYYYIHHYAGTGSIATSGAKIQVYQGNNLVATFNAPIDQGNEIYWNVFAIVNGEIVVNNTITDTPNTSYAD